VVRNWAAFATHPFKLLFLKNSQEFYLNIHANRTYFIQEDGPLVGDLEFSSLLPYCPSERPLFMAKEFTIWWKPTDLLPLIRASFSIPLPG
jgi:hypothetical protein